MFGVRFFQNDDGVLADIPKFSFQIGHQLLWSVMGLLFYPTQVLLLYLKEKKVSNKKSRCISRRYTKYISEANHMASVVADFHKEHFHVREFKDIIHT